jgi:predicted metal-dependent phosphoesterase TrpH
MLKCQFHSHCSADPVDAINYSAHQLIDEAARLQYDVLAITCHRHLEFSEELKQYAAKKEIILIPGIEFEINKKHILGINVNEEIYKVDSFKKLEKYKESHPECLIIAPHPFFPGPSLKETFTENITLFDAVEYSWAYTKNINFNSKAIDLAIEYRKPIIATSDCHVLSYLDQGYCFLECEKTVEAIISTIKAGKIKNSHKPTNYFRIARPIIQVASQTIRRKLKK